jgi:hypothetical protein
VVVRRPPHSASAGCPSVGGAAAIATLIWTDFTNSRQRLDRVLAHDLLLELPPPVLVSFPLSLVEHLGADSGRRAYGIERALQLIGEALQPLPGSKSVVLIGHGFGRFV